MLLRLSMLLAATACTGLLKRSGISWYRYAYLFCIYYILFEELLARPKVHTTGMNNSPVVFLEADSMNGMRAQHKSLLEHSSSDQGTGRGPRRCQWR